MTKILDSSFGWFLRKGYQIQAMVALLITSLILENKIFLYSETEENIFEQLLSNQALGYDNLVILFKGFGCFIAAICLISSFTLIMMSGIMEVKDSFFQLILRAIIAVVLVFTIGHLCDYSLKTGQNLYELMDRTLSGDGTTGGLDMDMTYTGVTDTSLFQSLLNFDGDDDLSWFGSDYIDAIQDKEENVTVFGQTINVAEGFIEEGSFNLIAMLINFIFSLVIVWNCIKLAVELIKRFVFIQLLKLTGPMFAGFFSSSTSMNVFTTYVKMFFTAIGIFLLTRLWIAEAISMMCTSGASRSLTGIICIYAFLVFGVKMEGLAKDFGLSSSSQGAALLDGAMMQAGIMGMALGRGFKNIGGGILNAGALAGNAKIAAVGNIMAGGRDKSVEGLHKAMAGSSGGALRKAIGNMPGNTGKSNLTKSQKANFLDQVRTGGRTGSMNAEAVYGQVNNAGKKELMNMLATDHYSIGSSGANLMQHFADEGLYMDPESLTNGIMSGSLYATHTGSDGTVTQGEKVADFSISRSAPKNGVYDTVKDSAGQTSYISYSNGSMKPGESRSMDGVDINNPNRALSQAEISSGIDARDTSLYKHDANGNLIGTGSNYTLTNRGNGAIGITYTASTQRSSSLGSNNMPNSSSIPGATRNGGINDSSNGTTTHSSMPVGSTHNENSIGITQTGSPRIDNSSGTINISPSTSMSSVILGVGRDGSQKIAYGGSMTSSLTSSVNEVANYLDSSVNIGSGASNVRDIDKQSISILDNDNFKFMSLNEHGEKVERIATRAISNPEVAGRTNLYGNEHIGTWMLSKPKPIVPQNSDNKKKKNDDKKQEGNK